MPHDEKACTVPCPDRARRAPLFIATAVGGLLIPPLAVAADEATQIDEISVISTRTPRRADDVPATVTAIPTRRIGDQGMHALADAQLLRGSDQRLLDESALEAVRRWRFLAAR